MNASFALPATPPPPPTKPKPLPWGGKYNKAIEWDPLPYVEEYLFNLKAEGRSSDYIRMVRVGLGRFSLFCRDQGIKHPDQIERTHILLFQAHLNEFIDERFNRPLKQRYKQQLMKYVRAWVNWMLDLEYITQTPWVRIKVGTTPKQPKPLEPEEIAAIFDTHRQQAFTIQPFLYHRREVVLVLLYGWGLRVHELAALNASQFDMRADWVTAINKGGGSKPLPYGPALKQVVGRYLKHRGKHAVPGEDALLIDRDGQRMTIRAIQRLVETISARAGVPINAHRLRDSFGTTMLDYDVEVERIMKMMGHSQIKQTLAYSRVNDRKLKESHDRVMDPLITNLVNGPVGQRRVCECLVRHPSSAHEVYTLRGQLFDAQVRGDALAIQVLTAQLTTPCPGMGTDAVGIHDNPPIA